MVAGPFSRPGAVCSQCGHIARDGAECLVCGADNHQVDDVVACVMESTVSAGGRVYQIRVPSALDVEGIGTLTRFPVSA